MSFAWAIILQLDGEVEYTYHEVVQKPIAPPYAEILEKMKSSSLKHSGIAVSYPKHFKWDSEEEEKERAFEAADKEHESPDKEEDHNKWSQDLADALPGID